MTGAASAVQGDLDVLITKLNLRDAVLVGFSMGLVELALAEQGVVGGVVPIVNAIWQVP